MAKKKRKAGRAAQLARRKLEQKSRKLAADRDRLFALSPGGSRERPMTIPSPAVIESRASAVACPQCQGLLLVDEHTVDRESGEALRLIHAHCRECRAPRRLWFRIVLDQAN